MSRARRLLASALIVVVLSGACSSGGSSGSAAGTGEKAGSDIPGVVFERAPGRSHRQGAIDYPGKKPPSGGNHNPVPLTCGYYDQQPPDEFAVHSLEHGAVWIAYGPTVAAADVAVLRALAKQDHVLVTPYAGMDTPITLVAWEHRLEVTSATDARIQQFINTFANGPSAPERGAACAGTGQPLAP